MITQANGRQTYLYKGYTYSRKLKLQNGGARWACTRSTKCYVYIHLDDELNISFDPNLRHNHDPDRFLITQAGVYIKI